MPKDLGQIAWDSYIKAVGGVAFNGDKLPTWDEMSASTDPKKLSVVQGWKAAAAAVAEYIQLK